MKLFTLSKESFHIVSNCVQSRDFKEDLKERFERELKNKLSNIFLYSPKTFEEEKGVYATEGFFFLEFDGEMSVDELINNYFISDAFSGLTNIKKHLYDVAFISFYAEIFDVLSISTNLNAELKKVIAYLDAQDTDLDNWLEDDANDVFEAEVFSFEDFLSKEQKLVLSKICKQTFHRVLEVYKNKKLKELQSLIEEALKDSPVVLMDSFFMHFVEHQKELEEQIIYAKKLKEWQIFSGIGNHKSLSFKTAKDRAVVEKLKKWARLQPQNFAIFTQYYPMEADVMEDLEMDGLLEEFTVLNKSDVAPRIDDFLSSPLAQVGHLLSTLTGGKAIVLNIMLPNDNGEFGMATDTFFCDSYGRIDNEEKFLEGMSLAQDFSGSIVVRQTAPLKIQLAGESKDTYRLYGAFMQGMEFNGLDKESLKESYSYDAVTGAPLELPSGDYMMDWKSQKVSFKLDDFLKRNYIEETDDFIDPRHNFFKALL